MDARKVRPITISAQAGRRSWLPSSLPPRGLGFMIQSAAAFLVTDVVLLGILVIALIAFALELAIRMLERLLVPWSGRA